MTDMFVSLVKNHRRIAAAIADVPVDTGGHLLTNGKRYQSRHARGLRPRTRGQTDLNDLPSPEIMAIINVIITVQKSAAAASGVIVAVKVIAIVLLASSFY